MPSTTCLKVGRKHAHRLKRRHDTDKTVRASRYECGAPRPDREDTRGTHLRSRLRRAPVNLILTLSDYGISRDVCSVCSVPAAVMRPGPRVRDNRRHLTTAHGWK